MKKVSLFVLLSILLFSCGQKNEESIEKNSTTNITNTGEIDLPGAFFSGTTEESIQIIGGNSSLYPECESYYDLSDRVNCRNDQTLNLVFQNNDIEYCKNMETFSGTGVIEGDESAESCRETYLSNKAGEEGNISICDQLEGDLSDRCKVNAIIYKVFARGETDVSACDELDDSLKLACTNTLNSNFALQQKDEKYCEKIFVINEKGEKVLDKEVSDMCKHYLYTDDALIKEDISVCESSPYKEKCEQEYKTAL